MSFIAAYLSVLSVLSQDEQIECVLDLMRHMRQPERIRQVARDPALKEWIKVNATRINSTSWGD
jgi:predicted Zn-dependent protease